MVYRSIDLAKDAVKTRLFTKSHYISAQNENLEGQRSAEYLNDKFQKQDFENSMKYNKVSFSGLL
jgi:hypothetical protein